MLHGQKWQTMIGIHVVVKTTDGYLFHLFYVGFTKKHNNQIQKSCYAPHLHQILNMMVEVTTQKVQTNDLKKVGQ